MVYDRATIKPAINQVELHPYLQQWEHKAVCDKLGVYMMAYFPLGERRCTTRLSTELPWRIL